jgi:hypothetical protein
MLSISMHHVEGRRRGSLDLATLGQLKLIAANQQRRSGKQRLR